MAHEMVHAISVLARVHIEGGSGVHFHWPIHDAAASDQQHRPPVLGRHGIATVYATRASTTQWGDR